MLMRHPHPELQFTHVMPYGAMAHHDGGVQFVVFSRSATAMRLLMYDRVEDREPAEMIDLNPETDRWGDVWSVFVPGVGAGQLYHLQADGPHDPQHGQWFDGQARLIDPYAKALAGQFQPATDGIIRPPKCVVIDDYFDWEGDRHLRRSLSETIIYEMHVRGFTKSPTSRVENPGTYLGVIEKIPYLQSLGVTAVELMPVHEFPIREFHGEARSKNYWGYDPMAFFAPASWLRGGHGTGVPGRRVQADGQSPAPGRHRSDPGRRLQPHLRRQRAGARTQFQGSGEPRLLHARQRRQRLQELLGLRQHGQRQSSDRPRDDLPLPATLGPQLSH